MRSLDKAALAIRSVVFLAAFYIASTLFLVFGSWLLISPRRWAMAGLKAHARTVIWLLRVICGTRMEVRGAENLLQGPVIVASKHQAAWDTFALPSLLADPAIVMKAELLAIPLYGWFCRKFEMIAIRRELGPSALRAMVREARTRMHDAREIVIFPEGTRRAPGAAPDYKPGILFLYQDLKLPVCPAALNSGAFWPRHSVLRYPGTIVLEFLDVIPPGLQRHEFMTLLEGAIETASARLIAEAGERLASQGYKRSSDTRKRQPEPLHK